MMQRRVLIAGIILAIVVSIVVLLVAISGNKSGGNPIRFIPQDALAIIRVNGPGLFHEFKANKNVIWQNISKLPHIDDLNDQILVLDSLARKDSEVWKILFEDGFYISSHYAGGNRHSFLSLVNLPDEISTKDLLKYINRVTNFSDDNSRKYEGVAIYSFSLKAIKPQTYFFSILYNTLIVSKSALLIEEAIRQSTLTNSLLDITDFNSIQSTAGKNKPLNLFIDFRKCGKLILPLLNEQLGQQMKNHSNFGGWAELDLNIGNDFLLFNGLISSTDSTDNFLSVLCKNSPVSLTMDQILPSDVNSLLAFGLGNPERSIEAFGNYLKGINQTNLFNERIAGINSTLHIDIRSFLFPLIENELGIAQSGIGDGSAKNYILIKCKSGSVALNELEDLIEEYSKKNADEELVFELSIDSEIGQKIFKMPVDNFCGKLFGSLFDQFSENYFAVIGNFLVFSDSQSSLSKIIYDNLLNRTLNTDETYKEFCSMLSQKSYMLFYTNLARSTKFFKPYLSGSILEAWDKNLDIFQKTQVLGFQVSSVSNMAYANLLLKNSENIYDKPRTVWESLMDTTVNRKPHFVENHYTKQNEILIQDVNHNIYLINQAGRILWKQSIGEPINSEIFQIDYFNNSKLQILFSTKGAIHLLDRNGNYVERYPIRLRAKATAGMSLIDYENDRNYRVFIPCDDKKVYAYSLDGTLINGWQFGFSDHIVESSVQHFKHEGKDFIVFADCSRIYIVDRKGKSRVELNKQFSKSRNNAFHFYNGGTLDKSYLLTTDSTGTIRTIAFDGVVGQLPFKKLSANHFFEFNDVDADGNKDYIFLDENTISVFQNPSNLIFTKAFNEEIINRPIYYHFSARDRKIGLVSVKDEKIYLLNNNGDLFKGFPLVGTTLFSIGYFTNSNSKFNLIVGGRNNFLYNYAVE